MFHEKEFLVKEIIMVMMERWMVMAIEMVFLVTNKELLVIKALMLQENQL